MPDSCGTAHSRGSGAGVPLRCWRARRRRAIGTLGIFYTKENKGRFEGGADRYRSRDLTDLVMTQIVSDIRRTWEPDWNRRGLWNRAYYEARVPGAPPCCSSCFRTRTLPTCATAVIRASSSSCRVPFTKAFCAMSPRNTGLRMSCSRSRSRALHGVSRRGRGAPLVARCRGFA